MIPLGDWTIELTIGVAIACAVVLVLLWALSYDARWRARYAQYLEARESHLVGMIADSVALYRDGVDERHVPAIVVGQSALSTRYFGSVLPDLRSRYRLTTEDRYAMLCQLARREALINMLEQARSIGCTAVCDVKIDSADLGHTLNRAQRAMIVITATGTAYRV